MTDTLQTAFYIMLFPRIIAASAQRKLSVYLKKGGLVAYPTESCYGLGCLPTLAKALGKLAHLKKRPQHKGMIVIGNQFEQLQSLLQMPSENLQDMLRKEWPAPKRSYYPPNPVSYLSCAGNSAASWRSGFPPM